MMVQIKCVCIETEIIVSNHNVLKFV